MTDAEKEDIARQTLSDLMALKNIGFQPGKIFRNIREAHNISPDAFARALDITPRELCDIEECRTPFPTMFLICIFIYGIPEWFKVKEPDAHML